MLGIMKIGDPLIASAVLIGVFAIVAWRRSTREKTLVSAQRDDVAQTREPSFLCDDAEDLGGDLVQLYGEPCGLSIRPGMMLEDGLGMDYLIREVYAEGDTPCALLPDGKGNTAIVLEMKNKGWNGIRARLKKNGPVAFKIQ